MVTFIVERFDGKVWEDVKWTDNGVEIRFRSEAEAERAIRDHVDDLKTVAIQVDASLFRVTPYVTSEAEDTINHLAGCNVPGRLRAILAAVEAGEVVNAIHGLVDIITRVEQRDVRDSDS
jgi:hypothetical protein